jgi:DNA-binding NtrC family response regulator
MRFAQRLVSPNARSGSRPRSLKVVGRTDSARTLPTPEAAEPRSAPAAGLVLLVDDEPLVLRSLARILGADSHRLICAETLSQVGAALLEPALDAVLLDLRFGAHDGRELLARIKREHPELEVIVVTGHGSVESAVECMRAGAFDYVEKPFPEPRRVRLTVQRAIERRRLVSRNQELERELGVREAGPALVGASRAMRTLQRTLASLRHNESTVLIQGESGTGKELVAAALHASSPRRAGPFVPVDCGHCPSRSSRASVGQQRAHRSRRRARVVSCRQRRHAVPMRSAKFRRPQAS